MTAQMSAIATASRRRESAATGRVLLRLDGDIHAPNAGPGLRITEEATLMADWLHGLGAAFAVVLADQGAEVIMTVPRAVTAFGAATDDEG